MTDELFLWDMWEQTHLRRVQELNRSNSVQHLVMAVMSDIVIQPWGLHALT